MERDLPKQRIAGLFEREWARFVGYVRSRASTLAATDAEDVVAEVLENLLRKTDLTAQVEDIVAYAYRSIANRIVDHLQLRANSNSVSLDALSPTGDSWYQHLPDQGAGLDEQCEQAYVRHRLAEAVSRLDPRQRAVWLATEVHGRSFRELADAWGEPIGTLLSRKSRANKFLRSFLSDLRSENGRVKHDEKP
jgi:RNA polymerase sigma factor (sigma-70 family)